MRVMVFLPIAFTLILINSCLSVFLYRKKGSKLEIDTKKTKPKIKSNLISRSLVPNLRNSFEYCQCQLTAL